VLGNAREHPKRLWLLPPLTVAWVNLHAGFSVGLLLVAITFAGELIRALWDLRRTRDPRQDPALRHALAIGAVGIACLALCGLNPYGWRALWVPFHTVSMDVARNYIQEWQSPDFHDRIAQAFVVLWILTFGAVGASRRRLEVTEFLQFGVFTALSLQSARNIGLFAVVAAPILSRHAHSAMERIGERWPEWRSRRRTPRPTPADLALRWVVLALVVAGTLLKTAQSMSATLNQRVIADTEPAGAASYLRAHPARGALFNAYNFGGYLVWTLPTPVYVDGRADLYGDDFLRQYVRTYMADRGFERMLSDRGVGVVIVDPQAPIATALLARPGWTLRYRDRVAVVITRDV